MKRLIYIAGSLILVAGSIQVPAQDRPAATKHALLVACTKYDHLKEANWLKGPANDVLLMQDFLQKKFGFQPKNITILSEAKGGTHRPLHAHIEREMLRLAKEVKAGDQVVILLSGHGSRQPQREPISDENFEPDGLDNIFLPADVKEYDDKIKGVPNAIVDDDLKVWLTAIRKQGASILIIVDACHSATIVRGNPAEVAREIPIEEIVPKEVIKAAREKAEKLGIQRSPTRQPPPFILPNLVPDLVAIYAAQRNEPTIEKPLPPDSEDAKPYGILTYNLVQIVANSPEPIPYTELVRRIQARYVEWGRSFPTPLVEGKDKDNPFLGYGPRSGDPLAEGPYRSGKSGIHVSKIEDEYRINAGALHRLTAGSILLVSDDNKQVGHVRIRQLRALDATVEPCEHAKMPAPKTIPVQNKCQVVFTDYGNSMRLRVAVEASSGKSRAVAADKIAKELERLSQAKGSVIAMTKDAAAADWLVRLEENKAVLIPATGLTRGNSDSYGPVAVDDLIGPWLESNLGRIARARNLVALAAAAENSSRNADGIDVGVELLRYLGPNQRDKFEVVQAQGRGIAFEAGETIAFRVSNRGRAAVDVSLLFVDSGHGVFAFFPQAGTVTDNRLAPGKSLVTPRARINAKTVGLEHLVVIAVKARSDEQPTDFSFLAQPTLEQARSTAGVKDPAFDSPLGRLFQNGLYRAGTLRGLSVEDLNDHALQVISWRSQPQPAKP